jgi:hypothetical protein
MPRLLRITFAWLLVLALPVQGVAAQAMLLCGPVHAVALAEPASAWPVAHDAHDHAAHGHGAAHAHVMATAPAGASGAHPAHAASGPNLAGDTGSHAHAEVQAEGRDGSAEASPESQTGHASPGKCSACASCCSMAFIAHAPVAFETLPPSPVYALTALEPHAGRTAGGLDRPPKPILA